MVHSCLLSTGVRALPSVFWRQVSKIETEKLLYDTISHELRVAKGEGRYHGRFEAQFHFFG